MTPSLRSLAVLLLTFGVAAGSSGTELPDSLYWTHLSQREIQRSNLDGGDLETLTTGMFTSRGIDLDLQHGKMYWTDFLFDGIFRADLDGSNVEKIVSGIPSPRDVAVDAATGKVYWSDAGRGKIQRSDLDGNNIEDLVVTGVSIPNGIALDRDSGHLYWSDLSRNSISRIGLDGSNRTDVLQLLDGPNGLAIDPVDLKIYWSDRYLGLIRRADLDGSNVETLIPGQSAVALAIDAENRALYWTDDNQNREIRRAKLDELIPETIVPQLSDTFYPGGIAIVPEPSSLALLLLSALLVVGQHRRGETPSEK